MPSQLFINPFPCGSDIDQHSEAIYGSLLLAGSATAAGEPINFGNIISGVQYNESNYRGLGPSVATASAYTTGFAISAGVATITAANNFIVGQSVTFANNTGVLSALFNGLTFTVATAGATSFTVLTSITGTTTTGDVGFVFSGRTRIGYSASGPTLQASVTSLAVTSAAAGVPAFITVTAANNLLPGASVTFSNLTTALGLLMNGVQFTVVSSTGAAFVVYSTLTGAAGADTGYANGANSAQPAQVEFWSANNSGYVFQYKASTGNLFVLVGGASASLPLAKLASAAYPAGLLGDLIKYRATFAKGM